VVGQHQHHRLGVYAKEVTSLKQEIERLGLKHGTLRQELRALESRIHDKEHELLTIYHRSCKCDQELL
jgi:predicted RNase H-like nuclease (RuvC/YqgF family)